MSSKVYKIISCNELIDLEPARVTWTRWMPDVDISIPSVSYGQSNPPDFPFWEWPPNNWHEASYWIHDARHYVLRDAKIHSETGVITVGDYCLKESLYMVFPENQGWTNVSETELSIPVMPETHIGSGVHACCGYVGNRNYAHWWIDVVPVLGHHVLRGCFEDATPILSQIRAGYQRQTLDLLPEVKSTYVEIGERRSLTVDELHFVPSLTGEDYHPQPWNSVFIQELKARVGIAPNGKGKRKIYLSRRDAPARQMINEDRICQIAEQNGFEVLETAGMALVDQIRIFADASHVISPHGAGLANLMFSLPGTRMLELHYDNCINWSLRRMAAALNLSYGCLIGRQLPRQDGQTEAAAQKNGWHLPEDQFERVISTQPFI